MRMYVSDKVLGPSSIFFEGTKKMFWSLCVCRNMQIEVSKNTSTTKDSSLRN